VFANIVNGCIFNLVRSVIQRKSNWRFND